jgi:hypothetical protein
MAKRKAVVSDQLGDDIFDRLRDLHNAPTDHGWSVDAGDERLGLFVTQRKALDYVKKCRARLTASGQRSTVLLTGQSGCERGVPLGYLRQLDKEGRPGRRRTASGACTMACAVASLTTHAYPKLPPFPPPPPPHAPLC